MFSTSILCDVEDIINVIGVSFQRRNFFISQSEGFCSE